MVEQRSSPETRDWCPGADGSGGFQPGLTQVFSSGPSLMASPPQPCPSGSSSAKSGHSILPAAVEGVCRQVSGRGYGPEILERW